MYRVKLFNLYGARTRWYALGFVLMLNAFPFIGAAYLYIDGNPSHPWFTRSAYIVFLLFTIVGLSGRAFATRIHFPDWMMLGFFIFALFGFVRLGFPGETFEYFIALNLVAYFIGRMAYADDLRMIVRYQVIFGLVVGLMFLFTLPELYHQWEVGGPKHPILYGFINTAAGLDIVLGTLPLLGCVLILFVSRTRLQTHSFLAVSAVSAVVALGVALSVLIASKSILFATLASIAFVVFYFRKHVFASRKYIVFVSLVLGLILGFVAAPENNIKYYGLTSVSRLVDEMLQPISWSSDQKSDLPFVMPTVDESDSGVVRLKFLRFSFQAIQKSPVIGVGVKEWVYSSPHPHNVIIETALMFGIPAAVMLSLFYLITIAGLIHKTSPQNELWLVSLIALLLYLLLYNIVQGQLASFRSLPLFLLNGLAAGYYAHVRARDGTLPIESSIEHRQHKSSATPRGSLKTYCKSETDIQGGC